VAVVVAAMAAICLSVAAPAHATACEGGGTACLSKIVNYEFQTQETYYNCGPASTRLALTARNIRPAQGRAGDSPSSGTVAGSLRTTTNGTNDVSYVTATLNSMAHTSWYASKYISYPVPSSALFLLKTDVKFDVDHGYVIVANVLGSETDDAGVLHSYSDGHYLTAVGYYNNGGTVFIEDVAVAASGRHFYQMSVEKFADWIANKGYSA
jgi:hypothetical protein